MVNLEEEIFNSKVKLQDIFDDIYEDCDSALADDFYSGIKSKMDDDGYVDLADAEIQLYIRDYIELHENDYQIDLLKRALGKYYDSEYDVVDDDVEESYEVLEEDIEEEHTFEEIIDRMEFAEIYEDLYNAAMCIVNPKLQTKVTKAIQQCEEDGDDVEEAYSIVTSDILDMYRYDKNVENLTENIDPTLHSLLSRLFANYPDISEEDEDYLNGLNYEELVSEIKNRGWDDLLEESKELKTEDVKTTLKDLEVVSFDELRDEIERLFDEGEIDDYYDDFIDMIAEQEEKCADYIRRRSAVTNTDWKDELGIEEDYVKSTIEEMIKSIKVDESKEIEESEENPQEFQYRMLSRLKSDCDYYLGNGNRDPEHCLWAKNEQGQIDEMRKLYNQLKEKPEWLSEEDINEYAKAMGVVDLPSTTNGTAEKEIQNMLDRAEKRSKEGLTESAEDKFSGTEFEKNIPHVMRFKEYDVKENDGVKTLYWVTQQFFTLDELEEFQNAFIKLTSDKMNFKDAYVTVRDLSHYDLDEDYEDGVLCHVTAQSIDYEGYEEACEEYKFDLHKGWLDESKKITEAEDMEEVKDEVTAAVEKSNATDLEKEQVAGSIEVLKTDEESAIEGYEDFNEETSKVVDKELADAVEKQMEEIIEDEKEHIEKLDTIQNAIEDNKEVKEEAVTVASMKDIIDNAKNDFQITGAIHTLGFADPELSNNLRLQYKEMQNNGMSLEDIKTQISQQLVPALESKTENKKEEFLDANINVDTGDISPNLDLGGLGALAGLVASEEEKESEEKLEEDKTIWSSRYEGDEETAEEAYQEYLDEFESVPKTPKSFEDWLEDTRDIWFDAEANNYREEHPEKDPDELNDWEIDEIDFEIRERVEKEIEANMDDLKEQYEEYCEEIKKEMTSPLDKEKWLTSWFEQDAQAQWEVMDEDFSYNVWPMIQNQCKDDILILFGSVGRWNGTFDGGKIIHADEKNIRNIMGDYDEVSVTADNEGHISMGFDHHDGTDGMALYTIPEDLTELAKAMGYEDPDELDMDIRQDNVDMEELAKNVNKLIPIINK